MAKFTATPLASSYGSTAAINANLSAIETAFENTLSRDGSSPNQMEADIDMNGYRILNELAQSGDGFVWEGAWVTATSYALNNLVSNGGNTYICTEAHTSGAVFATDLAAAKWELLASQGSAGAGTGDMLVANNLSELTATAATARGNISAAKSGANTDITSLTATLTGNVTGNVTGNLTGNVTGNVTGNASTATTIAGTSAPKTPTIAATLGASAMTVDMTSQYLDFRSATLTSGTITTLSCDPTALVVPATATLGTTSGVASRIAVAVVNDGGTAQLAVANTLGLTIDESALITTTTIGTGSDSTATWYSTTGTASKAFRIVGYIDSTQATAGAWATALTQIQGVSITPPAGTLIAFTTITSTNATWSPNASTKTIVVTGRGGGGGGGGGSGGNGGGGGVAAKPPHKFGVITTVSGTYNAAIGSGGTAGVYNTSAGGAGGTTSFGSVLTALGGAGGGLGGSGSATGETGEGTAHDNGGAGGSGGGAGTAGAANSSTGGGGGSDTGSGAAGGSGVIFVWEYA